MCKRAFVVVVLAGIVLATAGQAPLVRLQAASAQPAAVSPSRELLDRSEAPVVEADPVARAIADRVTASAATTATAGDRQGEDTTTPAPATPTKVDLTAPDQVPTDPPVPA